MRFLLKDTNQTKYKFFSASFATCLHRIFQRNVSWKICRCHSPGATQNIFSLGCHGCITSSNAFVAPQSIRLLGVPACSCLLCKIPQECCSGWSGNILSFTKEVFPLIYIRPMSSLVNFLRILSQQTVIDRTTKELPSSKPTAAN